MSDVPLEQHYQALLRFAARRLRSREAAADLVQDAYLRVAALPANTVLINPKAYLFGVAARLVVDHWRSKRGGREQGAEPAALEAAADPAPDAEAEVLSREELEVLLAAIDALPPRAREVFRLHRFEGLSYAEIAERLGIAKNTVMVHIMSALAHLRAALRQHRMALAPETTND
jgi:RNA polymerase sigma-70 factor (ECF subfamily)